ncbi:MAG: hypothetical protein ACXABJ_09155, partial [Candidatus Heimdallarchaeaceae archaeon]
KYTGSQYELHATDNFLLVIAYARLAEALQAFGDVDAIFIKISQIQPFRIYRIFFIFQQQEQ